MCPFVLICAKPKQNPIQINKIKLLSNGPRIQSKNRKVVCMRIWGLSYRTGPIVLFFISITISCSIFSSLPSLPAHPIIVEIWICTACLAGTADLAIHIRGGSACRKPLLVLLKSNNWTSCSQSSMVRYLRHVDKFWTLPIMNFYRPHQQRPVYISLILTDWMQKRPYASR